MIKVFADLYPFARLFRFFDDIFRPCFLDRPHNHIGNWAVSRCIGDEPDLWKLCWGEQAGLLHALMMGRPVDKFDLPLKAFN